MKKPSRDKKRELKERAPKRDTISTETQYDKERRIKKEEMVSASKRKNDNGVERSEQKKR